MEGVFDLVELDALGDEALEGQAAPLVQLDQHWEVAFGKAVAVPGRLQCPTAREEVDQIICWLTGYSPEGLRRQIGSENDLETFFAQSPKINPNVSLIKGVVCGIRVEEIEHPLMQKIRYLDKLIDELAKGKALDKILRQ